MSKEKHEESRDKAIHIYSQSSGERSVVLFILLNARNSIISP